MTNTARKLLLGLLGGSSSFSPLSIPGLALWLDASDASTLFQASDGTTPATADGDVVGYWGDKSGSGRHVTQGTTANKPTLQTAEQNGRNVVQFDGNDYLLRSVTGSDILSANAAHFVVVMKQSGAGTQNTVISWDGSGANRLNIHSTYEDVFYFDIPDAARVAAAQPGGWDNVQHILECVRDNTTSIIRVDGTDLINSTSAGSLNVVPAGNVSIGSAPSASQPLTGNVAELLLFKTVPTANEQLSIRAYLKAKWGMP
jgi:hypothetical protein